MLSDAGTQNSNNRRFNGLNPCSNGICSLIAAVTFVAKAVTKS